MHTDRLLPYREAFFVDPERKADLLLKIIQEEILSKSGAVLAAGITNLHEEAIIVPQSIRQDQRSILSESLRAVLRCGTSQNHYLDVWLLEQIQVDCSPLSLLVEAAQQKRAGMGMRTPFALSTFLPSVTNKSYNWISIAEASAAIETTLANQSSAPKLFEFTHKTGFGRFAEAVLQTYLSEWRGGTLVDVGGSIGVLAYQMSLRGMHGISVDIMSEQEASQILYVNDYRVDSVDKVVFLTPELREEISHRIQQVFSFDASTKSIAPLLVGNPQPIIISMQKVLIHLTKPELVVANAVSAIGNRDGAVWIDGYQAGGLSGCMSDVVITIVDGVAQGVTSHSKMNPESCILIEDGTFRQSIVNSIRYHNSQLGTKRVG